MIEYEIKGIIDALTWYKSKNPFLFYCNYSNHHNHYNNHHNFNNRYNNHKLEILQFLLTNIDTNMMTEYETKGIIDALDTGTSLLRLFLLGRISN